MKILFVAVFKSGSTNISQSRELSILGHEVIEYDYRQRLTVLGASARDAEIVNTCIEQKVDLVIFSKCNKMDKSVVEGCNKHATTALWFMDAVSNWDKELESKVKLCHYVCCDKKLAVEKALELNKNSYHLIEGFDATADKKFNLQKKHDVTFIGNVYGNRRDYLDRIQCEVFNNLYGESHARMVAKSRININLTTANCASDRIYKIMAAGGFLISTDWYEREDYFQDRKHLVIVGTPEELKEQVEYYLLRVEEREMIAEAGFTEVQKYSRHYWASGITKHAEKFMHHR